MVRRWSLFIESMEEAECDSVTFLTLCIRNFLGKTSPRRVSDLPWVRRD